MHSPLLKPYFNPFPPSSFRKLPKLNDPHHPKHIHPNPISRTQFFPKRINAKDKSNPEIQIPCSDPSSPVFNPCGSSSSPVSCSAIVDEAPPLNLNVYEKVQSLAAEFKSLSEPIDRVRRLLHYAALLPPFDESGKIQENRVTGCTAQVWLDVAMDHEGLMRFGVDSDSEITKGFCSCLIILLDGAIPDEVLSLRVDDLADMNVGLPSRGPSRVNTWHNVLLSMQKRTRLLLDKTSEVAVQGLVSLTGRRPNGVNVKGGFGESQSKLPIDNGLVVKKLVDQLKEDAEYCGNPEFNHRWISGTQNLP